MGMCVNGLALLKTVNQMNMCDWTNKLIIFKLAFFVNDWDEVLNH